MPSYTLKDKTTGEQWDEFCSWSTLKEKLDSNPNWQTVIHAPQIVHETGSNLKVSDGFREVISKVKEKNVINNIKDY